MSEWTILKIFLVSSCVTAAVQSSWSAGDHDMRQDLPYWVMISGHWPLFPARHNNMSCHTMRAGPGSQVYGSDHLMAVDVVMWWVFGGGGWRMESINLPEDLSTCPCPVHHIPSWQMNASAIFTICSHQYDNCNLKCTFWFPIHVIIRKHYITVWKNKNNYLDAQ